MSLRLMIVASIAELSLFCGTAGAVCVSVDRARLRDQPSPSGQITWVVGRYMPLLEVGRKGRWLKVKDLDGETHWVSGAEVSQRLRCVVVKSRLASLRTGPGAKEPLAELRSADKYTAFLRVESERDEGDYYWVEDESGSRFWIAAAQVWRPTKVSSIGF